MSQYLYRVEGNTHNQNSQRARRGASENFERRRDLARRSTISSSRPTVAITARRAADAMALVGLNAAADQLQIAREFAVLGDYDTARVYYQGVLSQVSRCAVVGRWAPSPRRFQTLEPRADRPRPLPPPLPRAGMSTPSVSTMPPIRSERYAGATRPLRDAPLPVPRLVPARPSAPAAHRLTSAHPSPPRRRANGSA